MFILRLFFFPAMSVFIFLIRIDDSLHKRMPNNILTCKPYHRDLINIMQDTKCHFQT